MENKYQYSKKIPIVTGVIFISFTLLSMFFGDIIDSTLAMTSISVSGGIFGSSIIWYLKKSQVENSFKLKCEQLKQTVNYRLYFIEESLKLQKKYNVSSYQIDEIESKGPIDEMENSTMDNLSQIVDEYDREGHEKINLQNY